MDEWMKYLAFFIIGILIFKMFRGDGFSEEEGNPMDVKCNTHKSLADCSVDGCVWNASYNMCFNPPVCGPEDFIIPGCAFPPCKKHGLGGRELCDNGGLLTSASGIDAKGNPITEATSYETAKQTIDTFYENWCDWPEECKSPCIIAQKPPSQGGKPITVSENRCKEGWGKGCGTGGFDEKKYWTAIRASCCNGGCRTPRGDGEYRKKECSKLGSSTCTYGTGYNNNVKCTWIKSDPRIYKFGKCVPK